MHCEILPESYSHVAALKWTALKWKQLHNLLPGLGWMFFQRHISY